MSNSPARPHSRRLVCCSRDFSRGTCAQLQQQHVYPARPARRTRQ